MLTQTNLIRLIRRSEPYEDWKRAVFLRDRFTCQYCGARNGRKRVIEADHIKPFAGLVKEYSITSVELALLCPQLWDIDNGRTLCHSCHQQTESYPKQFVKPVKTKKRKWRQ